ncbi:APC family permease [Methanocaldococcus infernus]
MLTLKDAIFLTITSIVGGGIFILAPLTYLMFGSSSIYGWILLILTALVMALPFSYATLKISESGGVYKFINDTLGKRIGIASGIIMWLSCVFALSGVVSFFNIVFNIYFSFPIKYFLVILITLLILSGLRIVGLAVRILGLTTILTILYICFKNGFNLELYKFNLKEAIFSVYYSLWSTTGWEGVTMPLSAFKDQRAISLGLIIGTLIIGILYLLFALTVVSLNLKSNSIEEILKALIGENIFLYICILTIIGSCAFSVLFTLSYMPYGFSKDKIFPKFFETLYRGVPIYGVLLNALLTIVLITLNVKVLVDISMFLTLVAYFILYLSVFKVGTKKIKFLTFLSLIVTGSLILLRMVVWI